MWYLQASFGQHTCISFLKEIRIDWVSDIFENPERNTIRYFRKIDERETLRKGSRLLTHSKGHAIVSE